MSLHQHIAFRLGDDDLPPVTLHYEAREGCDATLEYPGDPHEFEIVRITCWSAVAGRFLDIPFSTIDDAQWAAWDEMLAEEHDFSDDWPDDLDF